MLSNKIKTTIIFIVLFLQSVNAQNQLNLSWNAGSESDLYLYRIFRSTSANASTQIDCVQHPHNSYADDNFEKGVQYFYRLRAVDYSLNAGEYSDEISLAVPKISGLPSQQVLPADTTITINLASLADDPDDDNAQLVWSYSGDNKLTVSLANKIITITTPSNWTGQEKLTIKAADDEGFYDSKIFTAKSTEGGSSSEAPVFLEVPNQELDEDTQINLKLSDYVTDSDSNIEDLIFAAETTNSITLTVNDDVLTIKPAANWFGERTITATVTDEGGLSDQTTFTVTVTAINDAPEISALPEQVLEPNGSVVINLSPYVTDVDDSDDDLSWSFSNEIRTSLSFNETTKELTITALTDSSGFDYVLVSVTDPSDATGEAILLVRVLGGTSGPQIGTLPQVEFNEDGSDQLALNDYVTDADDPVQNLFWHNGTGDKVAINIDHTTNIATFIPEENWNGSEDVWLYVTDPNQNKDSAQVSVTVVPVNDRPHLSALPAVNLSAQLSRQINLQNYSTDIDNDLGDLSWTSSSATNVTVAIDESGIATFSVADSWLGQEKIQIFVSDPGAAKDTSEITIFRQDQANAPTISGLSSVTFNEDNQHVIRLDEHASDPNNSVDELEWSYSNELNLDIIIDDSSNEMTLVPNADWFGTEAIYLELRDPDNNVDFDTMLVTVSGVNDLPQLNTIGTISIIENSVHTIDLDQIIVDADGFEDIVDISVLNQGSSFIGIFLDMTYYQLTFFAPSGFYGTELFLLKVQDSFGEQAEIGFAVDVLQQTVNGSILVQSYGSGTNKNISYNTSIETKDLIEYKQKDVATSEWISTEPETSFAKEHFHILAGLEENTTYYYQVVSLQMDSTSSTSPIYEFTTESGREVNVFPIPYKAGTDLQENGISFINLPLNSEVKIYNMLGEPVFKTKTQSSYFAWNVENNAGKKVSSGLYIYLVKNEKNKKVTSGKIIVVR
ncbi:MAG: tandem-95 repeat protein [Calditrichaeota bacterium]|nr:MAG: tandem-95 repeat protein [Calditrichota bacterium]MBL1206314.1 tandem-95 repeat protein [Calditrichota bacterium]NOG46140.1 tandem-95 repeat protein [Calditrichota bacterium]